MDQDIYNKKTRNWVKGNFALNTARKALCGCIQDNFETFISTLTPMENIHLEQFFKCLKTNGIQQLKQLKQPNQCKGKKKTKTQLYCEHDLCRNLMGQFVKIHEENRSLCDCYQWSTVSSGYLSKDETKPIQSMAKSDKIWQITVLYMFVDRGESTEQYRGLEDLDISKVIKIMRNCSKFVTDGSLKLYDMVIEWRNVVMHSSNHNLDDESMKKMLYNSKQLLNCLQISKTSYYITATQDLQKTPQMMFDPKEYKDELKFCVEKQKEAVNSDISSSDGYNKGNLLQLRGDIEQYLEDIDAMIDESETEEMTNFLEHMEKEKKTLKAEIKRAEIENRKLETNLQEQKLLRNNIDKNELATASSTSVFKATDIYRRPTEINDSSNALKGELGKNSDSCSPTLIASNDSDSSEGDYDGIKQERSNYTWKRKLETNMQEQKLLPGNIDKNRKVTASSSSALEDIDDQGNRVPDHTSHYVRRAHKTDNDDDGFETPYMKQIDAEADTTMNTLNKSSYRNSRDSEEDTYFSENSTEPRTHYKYQEPKDQQMKLGRFVERDRPFRPIEPEEDETISRAPARLKTQASSKQRQGSLYNEDSDEYMSTEERDESALKDIAHNDDYKKACKKYVYFSKTSDIYSQWHASAFIVDDQKFNCAQQFMTYRKAVLFEDIEIADEILICTDPGKIRETGKKIKGFDQNTWQEKCIHIAKEGNRAKFLQNEELLTDLIATYPKILVEASLSNTTWGIGLNVNSRLAWHESTWKGKNYLGYVLTEVRDDIMIERGLIGQRGRKLYTDNLSKRATESENGERSQRYERDTSEIYVYFESGIYSMSHRSDFTADGQIFRSVQQYLMFKKAELFDDFEIAKEILASEDPKFLQKKGREVKGFKEGIWGSHRLQIAKDGNLAKNKNLRSVFVSTYPKEFVMASPTDKIWGIGLAEQDPRSRDKNTWNGKNYFGKILTEVRNMLLNPV